MARCWNWGKFLALILELMRFPFGYVLWMRPVSGSDIGACEVSLWIGSWNIKSLWFWCLILRSFSIARCSRECLESLWRWCLTTRDSWWGVYSKWPDGSAAFTPNIYTYIYSYIIADFSSCEANSSQFLLISVTYLALHLHLHSEILWYPQILFTVVMNTLSITLSTYLAFLLDHPNPKPILYMYPSKHNYPSCVHFIDMGDPHIIIDSWLTRCLPHIVKGAQ